MDMAKVSPTVEQDNFRRLVIEVAWFGLGLSATARFLPVFAIRLGASEDMLGWLAALPAFLLAVSTGLGSWWLSRHPNSTRALFLPSLGFRFIFLLPAFAPLFPPEWQLPWLLASASLPALVQGISSVVFVVMFRQSVSDERMTALLSYRALALNITLALSGLAFGVWLEIAPFPLNYQVMYLFAFVMALVSAWNLIGVRVPAKAPIVYKPKVSPWRSPGFQQVIVVGLATHIAFTMIVPSMNLRLVNELGAGEGFIALYGLAELVAGAVASILGLRIMKRLGNQNMIALAMGGTALAAVIIALAPSLYVTLLAAAMSGASWALAAMIGLFRFYSERTAPEDMPVYSMAYHQVLGMAMFIGPLLGTLLANTGISLVMVVLAGAALRVVAGVIIWQYTAHHPQRRPVATPAMGD